MKKLLFVLLLITSLIGCTSQKYGCDYRRGKMPKFRADIQMQGKLEKVLQQSPGKALLQMYLPKMDTVVYVYYGYCNRMKFEIGSKWTLHFDSSDTCRIKRSIVKLNS